MLRVELFDKKKLEVVDTTKADSKDDESVRKWLLTKGLTVSEGKVKSLATLPFSETNYRLRWKRVKS